MPTLTVYQLMPPHNAAALAFHFGRQRIGLEETSETLASDSLFAALVVQAAVSEADVAADGAPAWAAPFAQGQPPMRHDTPRDARATCPCASCARPAKRSTGGGHSCAAGMHISGSLPDRVHRLQVIPPREESVGSAHGGRQTDGLPRPIGDAGRSGA